MTDLSILVPSRNEMFLKNTIEDALKNIEADTEIIAVLDGAWAEPSVPQHERVNVIYVPEAIGQRAATNLACKLSKAKYVMKIDAHCSFDKGFDRKMLDAFKETGDNVTMVPTMRNLWAYSWKCLAKTTNIVTLNGLKEIQDIEVGEKIISGDGKPHRVLHKIKNNPTHKLVKVKPYQLLPIELTGDHLIKVYPYEYFREGSKRRVKISEQAQWIEAEKLKSGNYKMIYPFSVEEKLVKMRKYTNKEQLIRLLGYFVAEGNYAHKGGESGYYKLTFSVNQKEQNIADDLENITKHNFTNRFNKPATCNRYFRNDPRNTNKYMEVKIYSEDAVKFVKEFVMGTNSRNKRFIPEVLQWPLSLQKILLDTLVIGDGSIFLNRKNITTTYNTSSKELGYQIFTIMLRLGYNPGISEKMQKPSKLCKNANLTYTISSYSNNNDFNCKSIIRNNEYLVSVYKTEKTFYNDHVYDLTIEGLPEILTTSGIVHNCYKCGWKKYQGPTPEICENCTDTKHMRRKMMWVGKERPQSNSYSFDAEPHFQYFNEYTRTPKYTLDLEKTGLTETMSLQGSCFMLTRKKYWELDVCSEKFGSWGNQGIEVAVKTWLSGGRVLVNHNTWYAHMFRTQGGDFGFPYPQSGNEVGRTKQKVKDLFFNNKWEKAIHPLSWLIEKFAPIPGWTDEKLAELKKNEKILHNSPS